VSKNLKTKPNAKNNGISSITLPIALDAQLFKKNLLCLKYSYLNFYNFLKFEYCFTLLIVCLHASGQCACGSLLRHLRDGSAYDHVEQAIYP
jgi:hypothetical protein